ncbi:MAG TPA: hypothetical protein VJR46_00785 [Candidatus Dormibacteraeota bacterium]|nr:hypothetical protein [Candidatus Dormibacteraeota bacterium]
MSTAEPTRSSRHQNMYAHHLWEQQRFYALLLLVIGVGVTVIALFQHQLFAGNYIAFIFYTPLGLIMVAALLFYRWRNKVQVLDSGVKISNSFQSVVIDYDTIRWVKALPLRQHYENGRARRIVPFMKRHVDKPAVFLKIRGDEAHLAAIKKRLGIFKSGLMAEDVIAIPVPDADVVVWEISSHLPERIGQNQGGARRRKRRR